MHQIWQRMERKIKIAITHGDTNGIGYRSIFGAFADEAMLSVCMPIVYGQPKVASYHRKHFEFQTPFTIIPQAAEAADGKLNLLAVSDDDVRVSIGDADQDSARAALRAINRAIDDSRQGVFDVLLSMPTRSDLMHTLDSVFTSETAYMAHHLHVEDALTHLFLSNGMRAMLVSEEKTLGAVAADITEETVIARAKKLHGVLKSFFRLSNPRIAVLALNPEKAAEETEVITPAIEKMMKEGIQCFGPFVAKDYFGGDMNESFDAVLGMYHDQVVPQMLANSEMFTTITLGLPFLHFAISDGEKACLNSVIYTAVDICRNKAIYDAAHANPLPKLYHEQREGEERRPPRFAPLDFMKKKEE